MNDGIDDANTRSVLAFHRRKKIALLGMAAFLLLNLFRPWLFSLELPFHSGWLIVLWTGASFASCALFVWAFRCTVCKGWIKFDGVTCYRCSRRF